MIGPSDVFGGKEPGQHETTLSKDSFVPLSCRTCCSPEKILVHVDTLVGLVYIQTDTHRRDVILEPRRCFDFLRVIVVVVCLR